MIQDNEENLAEGLDYMESAAVSGDRACTLYLAKAYDTGNGLGPNR